METTPVRWLMIGCLGVLLSACGTFRDSAPVGHVDHTRVPNATPKAVKRSKYGNPRSYQVAGKTYHVMKSSAGYRERGIASWYGTKFHGRRTSSGEPYNMYAMTAAHKTLPIPAYVQVTNLDNGRKAIVRVNDRGPFVEGRIIDLSYVAAKKLGVSGTARVEVVALDANGQPSAPPPPPPAATPKTQLVKTNAANDGRLYLQVGAFTDRYNAEQLLSQLVGVLQENVLINRKATADQELYRVRIGPLQTENDAQRIQGQIGSLGLGNPHIVVD
jgi:rare lipoprotein A